MSGHSRLAAALRTGGAAVFACVCSTAYAQVEQIHPTSGTGGPIVIAVLADNFKSEQLEDFREAARNFLLHTVLADDHFFKNRKAAFTIRTVFEPVTPPQTSKYGYSLGASGATNCSIGWDQNQTATAVHQAASTAPPSGMSQAPYTHIVVIGNYDYNFGCSADNWSYLAIGAVGQRTILHELGHSIGGLFDEFSLPQHLQATHPDAPIGRQNCRSITGPGTAAWGVGGAGELPGCALYGKDIVHGFSACRMGVHGEEFCDICHPDISLTFDCWEHPEQNRAQCNPDLPAPETSNRNWFDRLATPAMRAAPGAAPLLSAGVNFTALFQPAPPPLLQLLLRLTAKADGPLTLVAAEEKAGRHVPMLRRIGSFVYEVSERGNVLSLGVLPGNPFEARAYNGGLSEHLAAPTPTATVLVAIPNETRARMTDTTRAVELVFYKLSPQAGSDPISRSRLEQLKGLKQATVYARLTAADLRAQLLALKP